MAEIKTTIGGSGIVAAVPASNSGTVAGQPVETGSLDAEVSVYGTLEINDVSSVLTGGLALTVPTANGEMGSSLSIRQGVDGVDGFSPIIEVYTETDTEYILKITDVNGSFLTPNLIPDFLHIGPLDHKVDTNLKIYPLMNPNLMNEEQKTKTFLYINSEGNNGKMSLGELALKKELKERVRLKLQTVDELPLDWEQGDYVFKRLNVS